MKLFIFGFFCLIFTSVSSLSFNINDFKIEKKTYNSLLKNIVLDEMKDDYQIIEQDDLLLNVDDFIDMPEGGTSWQIFGETGMIEYSYKDKKGYDWLGFRPEFKEKAKNLNEKEILIQGYMFPLEQGEKQKSFLLSPFPLSCPYHPHVSSNLTIEVHAKDPILFTYDAVNIKGKLELVEEDNLYNIFFRLKNSRTVD